MGNCVKHSFKTHSQFIGFISITRGKETQEDKIAEAWTRSTVKCKPKILSFNLKWREVFKTILYTVLLFINKIEAGKKWLLNHAGFVGCSEILLVAECYQELPRHLRSVKEDYCYNCTAQAEHSSKETLGLLRLYHHHLQFQSLESEAVSGD